MSILLYVHQNCSLQYSADTKTRAHKKKKNQLCESLARMNLSAFVIHVVTFK